VRIDATTIFFMGGINLNYDNESLTNQAYYYNLKTKLVTRVSGMI